MSRPEIQAYSQAREIRFLVHFTRLENLPSILQDGLRPVSEHGTLRNQPVINDERRLDGHLDGTSLSIAFPNHSMFFKYRQQQGTEWVVLRIDPSVLWTKDCGFCQRNAATTEMSQQTLANLQTLTAFQGMFDEIEGLGTRQEQGLQSFDPTDHQAEVLVFGDIEPHLITGVAFQTQDARNLHAASCGDRSLLTQGSGSGFFAARSYVRLY
ncbi:DarT ssDNA thymidine ADP-ribosyltransferase family protein [Pseudomonas sp. V104_6]|uniref:DarT ssDNA thymidine ADP-ribosyltransferase family protein n=1 Tax=Pseudomonas sp. V104_6 TaxID=3044230 RepID=UPI00249EAFB7|nr:DarT ssDNA thymidine ADP-ribosyltransferase family protein [Pseudomonas sp. V104_6]MDI3373699.1 DarT ssDNA thymidine ADP-ribosyltransferase family protein [Pseudomonas sp. V104_6]